MGVLSHARQRIGHVKYADSKATIDSLWHSMPSDDIYLMAIVLTTTQRILSMEMHHYCVPSHVRLLIDSIKIRTDTELSDQSNKSRALEIQRSCYLIDDVMPLLPSGGWSTYRKSSHKCKHSVMMLR